MTRKQSGPKYQRYFYAYSDKMLVHHVDSATQLMQDVLTSTGRDYYGESCICQLNGPKIPLNKSILTFELPDVTGDLGGRYGIIFVPENKASEFVARGPAHSVKTLGPREMDPPVNDLIYLADFNPIRVGKKGTVFSLLYEDCVPIPYRKPVTFPPMYEIISEFYPHKLGVSFDKQISKRVQTKYLHLHSGTIDEQVAKCPLYQRGASQLSR